MEIEEAHCNLRAIRLLYRLLEDNSVALHDANSENVVERARVLLKSLLDVAVEIVFETHLKTMATQAGISKTSIEQEKHVEQPQFKLLPKKELSELSKLSISDSGGTESKTLCSLGEEKGMMQQNLVKETLTHPSNEKGISPNMESCHHEQQHNNVNTLYGVGEHVKETLQMFDPKAGETNDNNNMLLLNNTRKAECNSSAARLVESLEQKGDFSDDLVNTIKRIESRILAFQLCSDLVDSTKNGVGHSPLHKVVNLESPKILRKDRAAGSELSCRRSFLEGHMLMNQQTDKSSCKDENLIPGNEFEEPFLGGNESLSQSQVVYYRNYGLHTNSESAKSVDMPKQIGTQLVSRGGELTRGTRIQPPSQNMAMIDRVKSLNRLVSNDAHLRSQASQASECIQGLRVPLNQSDLTKKPSMYARQTNRDSLVRKAPVAWSKTDQNQKERSSESSHAQKLVRPWREKPLPHQMVIKPTLLDQRSSKIKVNSHQHSDWSVLDRGGTHKTGRVEPWKTTVRPQRHELEELSSNSYSSSHWTSQQGSGNSCSDSEDSSLPQGPKSRRMVDAANEGSSEESSDSYLYKDDGPSCRVGSLNEGSSEESGDSYLYKDDGPSHRVGSLKKGSSEESSDSYLYNDDSPSHRVGSLKKGSSEESSDSYLYNDDGPSHRVGSLKSYRYHRERNPKKTIGSLKRLKNKLGLIFHHHHHHHHHHHDDDNGIIHSNAGRGHSMWNPLQNAFYHKNKHGMLTRQQVEKTKRGTVAKALPRSNQVGQFHRLVEGLLRHIRHSKKKPKPSKHGLVKGSRNTPHGHSQKKLHWWQILRRRRGVKLKNKGRVKMGFISQKSLKN